MPTGFTAKLYDGDQDFKSFVRDAARGMGASYHLREASPETPLTYPPDERPRALERYRDALSHNFAWQHASEEEKYEEWSDYVTSTKKANDEADHSEFYARRDRFDAMIKSVQDQSVPGPLESFKAFMLQQLGTEFQYSREPFVMPVHSYEVWCDVQAVQRQRREDLARKDYYNTRKRYTEVCEFIDLLAETFGFKVEK